MKILPNSDCIGTRDYVHVMDLSRGHLDAIEHLFDGTKKQPPYQVWKSWLIRASYNLNDIHSLLVNYINVKKKICRKYFCKTNIKLSRLYNKKERGRRLMVC